MVDSFLTGRQAQQTTDIHKQVRRAEREAMEDIGQSLVMEPLKGKGKTMVDGVALADKDEVRQYGVQLLSGGKLVMIDNQFKIEGNLYITLPNGQCLNYQSHFGWLLFKNPGIEKERFNDKLNQLNKLDPMRQLQQDKVDLQAQVAQLKSQVDALSGKGTATDSGRKWTPLADLPNYEVKQGMTVTDCRVQISKIFRKLSIASEYEVWFLSTHQMYIESGYPKDQFVNLVKDLIHIPNNTVTAAYLAGEVLTDVQLWNKLEMEYGSPFSAHHLLEQAQSLKMSKEQIEAMEFHHFATKVEQMVDKSVAKIPKVTLESRKAFTKFLATDIFLNALPAAMQLTVRDRVAQGQVHSLSQAVESAMSYARVLRHTLPHKSIVSAVMDKDSGSTGQVRTERHSGGQGANGGHGGQGRQAGQGGHRGNQGQRGQQGARGGANSKRTFYRRRVYACKACQDSGSKDPCFHCYLCCKSGHIAKDCTK